MTHSSNRLRAGRRGQRAAKRAASRERPSTRTPNSGKSMANRNSDLGNRFEHYLELARSATMSGDEVTAQSHYQHAEHYFRLINAGAV